MSRGFAGGLAEGLNQGMQIYAMHEGLKSRAKQDERADAQAAREAEDHEMKRQQVTNNRKLTETMASILGWKPQMAGGSPTNPDAPSMGAPAETETPSSIKLAGPIPSGGLAMAAPASSAMAPDNPAAALKAPAQQAAPVSPDTFVQRQILQGNAFGNPEVLNQMAAAAFQFGQGEKALAFLNMAHTAHEKGLPIAVSKLLEGDGAGAADVFRGRGIKVEGDLKPVEGKPHVWEGTVDGKPKQFNVREMAMAANPMEAFSKMDEAKERTRKAEMDEKTHALAVKKQANDDIKTKAEVGALGARAESYRALARERDRKPEGGLKASTSSAKNIGQAITQRESAFDKIATVPGEDGEKDRVDQKLRGAYSDAATTLQSIIEDETGEELDHRSLYKVTEEVSRMRVTGTPQEKNADMARALRRFKLDAPAELKEQAKEPEALGGKTVAKKGPEPEALKQKKEPTREEKELGALESHRDYPTLRGDLKKLQKERYAENLTAKEKAEVEAKIKAILDSDKPGLRR